MKPAAPLSRDRLVRYLDDYLGISNIPDASFNGLQVEGSARVSRVAYAVDASLQTIRSALRSRAQMLIVHHGLFWGGHEQIVGNMHKRVAALIQNGLSLYAAHLPLDCHREIGNNVEIARLLGMESAGTFGEYNGVEIGVRARLPVTQPREVFSRAVGRLLGAPPTVFAFGAPRVRDVAVVSGHGARFAESARVSGCDTLLTGETDHASYHPAKEAGINLICGGHYATETFGLKALARKIEGDFSLRGRFLSAPTGL